MSTMKNADKYAAIKAEKINDPSKKIKDLCVEYGLTGPQYTYYKAKEEKQKKAAKSEARKAEKAASVTTSENPISSAPTEISVAIFKGSIEQVSSLLARM